MRDNSGMRRRLPWLIALLGVPVSLTLWLLMVASWLGVWGGANVAYASESRSLPALSRGVAGLARSAEVTSWVLEGWGAISGVVPPMGPVQRWGNSLSRAANAALTLAPALPDALGENGSQRYLISSLNDGELFGSGGAPLDVAVVEIAHGEPSVVESGSVAGKFNPANEPYQWPIVGGPPWYRAGREYPMANSNFHPNFPFSGQNMISAWEGLGQPALAGVVTIDMKAVAEVLRATGPIYSGDYGQLTGDNIIRKVLVDAYRTYPDTVPSAQEKRRAMNEQLRRDLIAHLSEPGTVWEAIPALGAAIAGRHIQAFMVDPVLQKVVVAAGAQAALDTPPGDILGVFIQSGVSKLAVFQEREISHEVLVHEDGSAEVRQRISFKNSVPDGLVGDPDTNRGYLALIFRQRVAYRIPQAATQARVTVDQGPGLVRSGRTGPFTDDSGAQVLWQGQDIPPGKSRSVSVTYNLPEGALGPAGTSQYVLTANPQAMVKPVTLRVSVQFEGRSAQPATGWTVAGDTATWEGTLDRTITLRATAG